MKRWTPICCIAACLACLWSAAAPAGVRRALLIGINEYRAVPQLQGSRNDVDSMREILTGRWHFDPANIEVLLDGAATRAAILSALQKFVQSSGPDDTLYVHYSGHGSQVEDQNGDEPDGLDETIVPVDGRMHGIPDITDDELDRIFSRLRTQQLVVVLDSCHSGTATRALDIRARSIPQDTRVELYKDAPQTRAIVPTMKSRFLVISAASSEEEALDGPIDGRYHGFFTYALARSASTHDVAASPRALFAGVADELNRIKAHFGRNAMPEPQLEGPPARFDQPMFSSAATGNTEARLAWVATARMPSGEVRLLRGAALGATPGSKWIIYGPDENQFTPGRALAAVEVVRLAGADAMAKPESGTGAAPANGRAVMLLPAPNDRRIPVRIVGIAQPDRSGVEAALSRDIRNVSFVNGNEPARFMIGMQNGQVQLLTADGLQIIRQFGANDPNWTHALAQEVHRFDSASELLTLDNPSSALHLTARLANESQTGTRGVTVVADTRPTGYRIRRGDEPRNVGNSLQLEISVDADAYLTVVDVDSAGGVNLLFPNEYHERRGVWRDGRVDARELVRLPDALAPGNRAGFYWDYSPPAGIDTIRVFASTSLAAAQEIRARIGTAGGGQQVNMASAVRGLRSELAGLATRGVKIVGSGESASADATQDWAAVTLTASIAE